MHLLSILKVKVLIRHLLISWELFYCNQITRKTIWCFPCQYAIWLYRQNENILRSGVTYLLWHGRRHIKIWGVIVYIINECATIKKLYDRSHRGYFMWYAAPTGVILYWKPDQTFFIHIAHHVWFDEYNSRLSIEDTYTPGSLLLFKI